MAMSMRQKLEAEEDGRLAPFAIRSRNATRRCEVESDGRAFDYRTAFQRDRDRIVYSRAFRRLRQKAQTGILPAYEDHRRNRLTHTLEVVQVSRTIGRALDLNEDLIEAIAIGHDLGQPPFGPIGESALDALLSGAFDGRGGPGLGDIGGFYRSWQGLRVIDLLEKRYTHPGLNLTDQVREGILKSGSIDRTPPEKVDGVRKGVAPSFETQVVVLADRIASSLSDLDDALQAGVIEPAQVERLEAVRELRRKLGQRYPARAGRFMKANAIHRGLTHLLVTGAIIRSGRVLAQWASRHGVTDPGRFAEIDPAAIGGKEIDLPAAPARFLEGIDQFLESRVRTGYEPGRCEARGRRVLLGLFAAYHMDPRLLQDHVLFRYREMAGVRYLRDLRGAEVEHEIAVRYRRDRRFARVVADYLAGMTDVYAVTEHSRLRDIGAIPIPGVEQLRREEETP